MKNKKKDNIQLVVVYRLKLNFKLFILQLIYYIDKLFLLLLNITFC